MKNYLIALIALALSSCHTYEPSLSSTRSILVGRWQEKKSSDQESLRFKRSDSHRLNIKSLHFKANGELELYFPFGCQMPPYYQTTLAQWKVLDHNTIEVDRGFPGEKAQKWHIVKLRKNEFRFIIMAK